MDHMDDDRGDCSDCSAGSADSGADIPVESGSRSQALLDELTEAEHARIRAEARVSALLIDIDQARTSEAADHDDPRVQALEASSAADDISLHLGLTRGAVSLRLDEYAFICAQLPSLWARHQGGLLDEWRMHIIAETARETLADPANYTVLDEKLDAWLEERTYTPGQLRAWLRRTTARLEPEHTRDRTESAWQERHARIIHDDTDGTATLFSTLSAGDGIAVGDLIDQLARQRAQDTDGLTAQQACADVIADLLLGRIQLNGTTTDTSRVQARIGVLVPVDTLAGLAEEPGTSFDRQTTLSAEAVRRLAALPGTLFRRLLTDQAGDDLLEVTSSSYRASDALREAIAWRDGQCAFPTCSKPATGCDLDHIQPWPEGATTAGNLHYLCRHHHRLKSHGLLPARDPTG